MNSSRFPYYSYMQGFWEGMGIRTTMNTRVTLADLRRMDRYDLCILSAHGAYYTYSYGALWKRTRTEPIILLTEESTFYKDIVYSFELLSHRVIKMNGLYCATADFFCNASPRWPAAAAPSSTPRPASFWASRAAWTSRWPRLCWPAAHGPCWAM